MVPLPVDAFIDSIVAVLGGRRAVVVTAQPGAGKTTRIPPALAADGPVILLQPRRVAARSIASRIAEEQGWVLGEDVGWQVRFERRFSDHTRLLVVTEGVLTARLQRDPLLSDFRTVIFDEFHERSLHGDLAIALAKQAWRARDDLRIVVMSATLETAPVAAFLDRCPIVDVPGLLHPMTVAYAPGRSVADQVLEMLGRTDGDVLCFLPGAAEIRRTIDDLARRVGGHDIDLVPLHGSLDAAAQSAAIRPGVRRRVVVATNIAETSLTVPGVRVVVDSGLQKIARFDAERVIDSLDLERISDDAAEQRAGRAARLGPGTVCRLWDERDRLRPHREPEIHRIDLSGPLLDVIAAGWDPRSFEWFDPPKPEAIEQSLALLARLELVDGIRLTRLGERARRLPVHPRLARALLAANGSRDMARATAILAERHLVPPRRAATSSDLLSALDDWATMPSHVQRVAREIESSFEKDAEQGERGTADRESASGETAFLKAVLAGYPDRVAQRRGPGEARVRLASGVGAILTSDSGVTGGEFFVALDVLASDSTGVVRPTPAGGRPPMGNRAFVQPRAVPNDARIRLASRVEREWLAPNGSECVHRFDPETGTVKATLVERYDALVLSEQPAKPDSDRAAALLAEAWLQRGPRPVDELLLRRLRFAGREINLPELVRTAAQHARTIDDVEIAKALASEVVSALERDAPRTITVPSGRSVPLEYDPDGGVSASVKLQELFGLGETPRVGPSRAPVLMALLAPNGRPVQLTRDLRSFWDRTYPEVRKELRGRYPKHPWPDDPWNAPPTRRAKTGRRP